MVRNLLQLALPIGLLAIATPAAAQDASPQRFTGQCYADEDGEKLLRENHPGAAISTYICDEAEWVPGKQITLWRRETPDRRVVLMGRRGEKENVLNVEQVAIDGGALQPAHGICVTAMIQKGTRRAFVCSAAYPLPEVRNGVTAIFIATPPTP